MTRESDGLGLLLNRTWTQEVVHQLVLRELLEPGSLSSASQVH